MNEINIISIVLAVTPVIVIFILLAIRHVPADIAGAIGWLVTVFIAWLYFKTALNVVFLSSLAGIIASLQLRWLLPHPYFKSPLCRRLAQSLALWHC